MNLMILSPGRRVEMVQYFKKEIHKLNGKVFTLDMSKFSPALYEGDEFFVINKDFNNLDAYVKEVLDICVKNQVTAVLTLIDPELELMAKYKDEFSKKGIKLVLSECEILEKCFDKYEFYKSFKDKLQLIPTFIYEELIYAINNQKIDFPIFCKPRSGSGSNGIHIINSVQELEPYKNNDDVIFQPYIKLKEFGVDIYFDMINGNITSLFMKEKINMRSGETDKAISIFNENILKEVLKIGQIEGFYGPIDVDVFEDKQGNLYINEINPRFGGGYPHAYNCNVDFIKNIILNLKGIPCNVDIGNYENGIVMMKYNGLCFRKF